MIVRLYRFGGAAQNFQVNEGTTISQLIDQEGISIEGGHTINVNSKAADPTQVLRDGDRISITRSQIKGGNSQ